VVQRSGGDRASTFGLVGALIASRRQRNGIGWLFLGIGLSFAVSALASGITDTSPFRSDAWQWGTWVNTWAWVPGWFFMISLLLLIFPDGHLPSRGYRWFARLAWASVTLSMVGGAFDATAGGTAGFEPRFATFPTFVTNSPINPELLGTVCGLVAMVGSVHALVRRFRRSRGEERLQMKWFVYGAIATVILLPFRTVFVRGAPWQIIGALSLPILPLAVGMAILRRRLYEIDVVINRTVVYGLLAAFITAVYVGIVVGLGAAIGTGAHQNLGLSILATAIVALAFQPVRERVQRLANRLVYGERATPYEVLSGFSARMAGTMAVEDLLPRMARVLAEATGAVRATVWLRVGDALEPEAEWPGSPARTALPLAGEDPPAVPNASLTVPVRHRGELLGALSLAKPGGERVAPAEEKLAWNLASQAGLVLRNARLIEELRASRTRLVKAQDEERRKLERNIHDGAQQQLVAISVKLGLARTLLHQDEARALGTIEALQADAQEALENLRDLARGIFPPLLADQGLAAALSAQARKIPLPVEVRADGLGRYPKEVEAAVYFCALEALQNATKYAGATRAVVHVANGTDGLRFSVEDDGRGFDLATTPAGTGLRGMADRLDALGGHLEVRSAPGRGTSVEGTLPLRVEAPVAASA
jgi:signal transduction histidine kinase